MEAFVAAAAAGKTDALWGMLSTAVEAAPRADARRVQERLPAASSRDSLGSFRDQKVIVSERITPEFGIVAIDGRRNGKRTVYAVPLRLEGTEWRLELGSPVMVGPLGPLPGKREPVVAQIAAAVTGPGGSGNAVMYLDGHTENPKVAGTASNATLYANFEPPLDPGRHTVVVFASDGRRRRSDGLGFHGREGFGLEALRHHEHEDREPPGGEGEEAHASTVGGAVLERR